jgi:hypothetical protein
LVQLSRSIQEQGRSRSLRKSLDQTFPFLEYAYVSHERFVLSMLQGEQVLDEAFATVKEVIAEDSEACRSLESLCDAGCEKAELVWLLLGSISKPGYRRAWDFVRLDADELNRTVHRLEECASQIRTINKKTPFGGLVAEIYSNLIGLPDDLSTYAGLLREGARHFGRGTHTFLNIAKARVVTHVRYATEKWHDREVAALIGVVANSAHYAADNQRRWLASDTVAGCVAK